MKKFLWILPCALTLGLYWKTLHFGFVWDDFHLVDDVMPHFKGLGDSFTNQEVFDVKLYYYRPLFYLSLILERMFWGLKPEVFHATMIVSNLLAVFLAYWVAWKILHKEPNAHWAALVCSSLFAVHPIHTEVVAWSGYPDTFMAIFLLASFFFYLHYRENLEKKLMLFLSLACYFLALLSKETAVLFFFCLVLYDIFFPPEGKPDRRRHLWFGSLLVLYFVLRHQYLSGVEMPSIASLPLAEIVRKELAILGLYIQKVFYPVHLNAFIAEVPKGNIFVALGVVFLLIFLFAGFLSFWKKQGRLIFFNLFLFLAILLPALVLVLLPVASTVAAERYLYLPVFGIFFLAGLFFIRWPAPLFVKTVLVLGMVGVLSYKTYLRIPVWNSEFSSWIETGKQNPNEVAPLQNLARAYQRIEDFDTAMVLYEKALKATNAADRRALIYNNMGAIQMTWKKDDAAIEYFEKSIESVRTYVFPYCNLGSIYYWKSESAKGDEKKSLLTECVYYLKGCVDGSSVSKSWNDLLDKAVGKLERL